MAMPASGCIGLRCCFGTTACSSIGIAVCGSLQTPTSLCAMSVAAGKAAPHAMTEFYGYSQGISVTLNLMWDGTLGATNGMGGRVNLKCGTTCVCTGLVTQYSKSCTFNWTPPAGTYCVDFSLMTGWCDGTSISYIYCWSQDGGLYCDTTKITPAFSSSSTIDWYENDGVII